MLKNTIAQVNAMLVGSLKRFPIPVLCSLIFCIICIELINKPLGLPVVIDSVAWQLEILFCGCIIFISLRLIAESRGWKSSHYYILATLLFLAVAGHIYYSAKGFFIFLSSGLFLSMFIAPFLGVKASGIEIGAFSYSMWARICFVAVLDIILGVGLTAFVTCIYYLFAVKLSYLDLPYVINVLLIILITLFSPLLAMVGIPRHFKTDTVKYYKGVETILFCLVLLMLAYAAILYLYALKILANWNLPKGQVAYIVLLFSCAGIMLYLISYPLASRYGIVSFFSRYFFKLLVVPLLLLAIGTGMRITEFGVTEGRYALVILLVWLSLCTLFVLYKGKEPAPKFIYLCLVLLLLLSSFGPWGAVEIARRSQIHRLEMLLKKTSVLVDGKIQAPSQPLNEADKINICSILEYMVRTDKADSIKHWFSDMPEGHIHKKLKYYAQGISKSLEDCSVSSRRKWKKHTRD